MEDIKNASDLELAIGTLIPRIEDDYDVIREADNRIYELEGIITSKLRQEPPQDVSHERELISILNTNKGLFKYGDEVAEVTRVAGKFPQPNLTDDLAKVDEIAEDMAKFDPTDMNPKK